MPPPLGPFTSYTGTLKPMGPLPSPTSPANGNNVTSRYVVLEATSPCSSSNGSVMSDYSRVLQDTFNTGIENLGTISPTFYVEILYHFLLKLDM